MILHVRCHVCTAFWRVRLGECHTVHTIFLLSARTLLVSWLFAVAGPASQPELPGKRKASLAAAAAWHATMDEPAPKRSKKGSGRRGGRGGGPPINSGPEGSRLLTPLAPNSEILAVSRPEPPACSSPAGRFFTTHRQVF